MNMLGYGLIHLIELKPLSLRPLNIDSHYGSKITMASSLTLSILLPKKKKEKPLVQANFRSKSKFSHFDGCYPLFQQNEISTNLSFKKFTCKFLF